MCKEVMYSRNSDFWQKTNVIDEATIKWGKLTKQHESKG